MNGRGSCRHGLPLGEHGQNVGIFEAFPPVLKLLSEGGVDETIDEEIDGRVDCHQDNRH